MPGQRALAGEALQQSAVELASSVINSANTITAADCTFRMTSMYSKNVFALQLSLDQEANLLYDDMHVTAAGVMIQCMHQMHDTAKRRTDMTASWPPKIRLHMPAMKVVQGYCRRLPWPDSNR